MHDALLISEVLDTIVDCLAENIQSPDENLNSRHALAVLARTCRTFSGPALDALWRKLDSLKPFILCLPSKASYNDDTLDEPLPPFNEEEWNVVLRYAPRVRELTLVHDDLSVKILQSLWFCTPLLLPNLRKLNWTYGDPIAVSSIRLLLSPSLVHLYVWLEDGHHTSVLAFLEWYHIFCPNLRSLHFRHTGHLPDATATISRAICRSQNVEILSCDRIDEDGLIHVAQSRCLRKFSANLLDHEPHTLMRIAGYGTPDRPHFENLRILDLWIRDPSFVTPFLKTQNQPFEEITLYIRTVSAPEVLHELFTALSSATRRKTLRRMKLFTTHWGRLETSSHTVNFVDYQILSPLMTFNLRDLAINIDGPISLNDDELVRLAQAWPELETLHFNDSSGWDYPPSIQLPTLRGLVLLLARCPKLRNLGLCFDAANIPPLSEYELSIRNTAITKLSVSNSPIREPIAKLAHFLLEHLPSLTVVQVHASTAGRMDYYWAWRRVDMEIGQIVGRRSPVWNDDGMDLI